MLTRVINIQDIGKKLYQDIKEILYLCFSAHREFFVEAISWHGSVPAWVVILEDNEKIIAYAGVVERKITVGDLNVNVAGIQNVCVLPEHRNKNYCGAVLNIAMREALIRNYDYGVLFCDPNLVKIYLRYNWNVLNNDFIRIDENNKEMPLPDNNVPMFYPLIQTEFPTGQVHLNGNDW